MKQVIVNCRVQSYICGGICGGISPCTLQVTETFGSKHPASYFELLLRVLLWNNFAVQRLACSAYIHLEAVHAGDPVGHSCLLGQGRSLQLN